MDLDLGGQVRREQARRIALVAVCGSSMAFVVLASSPPAHADTSAYELYCPKTPVGDTAMNATATTGPLSPAKPASGKTFSVTNLQTSFVLPQSLVQASAALGNKTLTGSFKTAVDAAAGATPTSISTGKEKYKVTIPKKVPAAGLDVLTPTSPATVGTFTASSKTISLSM